VPRRDEKNGGYSILGMPLFDTPTVLQLRCFVASSRFLVALMLGTVALACGQRMPVHVLVPANENAGMTQKD
jgi:hypothetical protein